MTTRSKMLAVVGAAALAVPAVAAGKPGNGNARGHGKPKSVQYVLKGSYAGNGVVSVSHGNGHAKRAGLVGTDVALDLSSAKISAADTNSDGVVDESDVLAGDRVLVQARLPKGDPGAQPFAARHLVDKTNPAEPESDGDEDEDGEAPPSE